MGPASSFWSHASVPPDLDCCARRRHLICDAEWRCREGRTPPEPYPKGFRGDVVRVARDQKPGEKIVQIAKDFGISAFCLTNWMRQADIEHGKSS